MVLVLTNVLARVGDEGATMTRVEKGDDDDEEEEDVSSKKNGDDNVPTYKNAGLVSGNGGDLRPRRNLDVHFTHWAFVALITFMDTVLSQGKDDT